MHLKYLLPALALVVAIALLCGCTGPAPAGGKYANITDNFGRVVVLDKEPQRIVSLSPANTEMLFDLGLGDRIVGDTDFCDYPPAAKNITHVSGFTGISMEKLVAANPDVIFAEDITGKDVVDQLTSMGYRVIAFKNTNLSMIEQNIRIMGQATGTQGKANALVSDISARVQSVSARTARLTAAQKPSVLLMAGYLAGQPIYVYGSGTYGDDLFAMAGGTNAAHDVSSFKVMSTEAIIQADPDYIVVPVDGTMTTTADFDYIRFGNESWMKGLKAVQNGHVVMVDGNLMLRPGPRLPDAGLVIARAIHPDLFP